MAKRIKKRKTRRKKTKRMSSYENYVKRHEEKKKKLKEKGYDMISPMMDPEQYERAKQLMKDSGIKININQTIVSEQAYEYDRTTARRFRKVAKEHNLEWDEKTELEIMKGGVDVSALNNLLKETHPEMTGYDRRNYISQEVFGSP